MHLDILLPFSFVFLPLVFAVICLYYAFGFLKQARLLEGTPGSKIRSAAQGFVDLSGIAKPLPTHVNRGKLTQIPCAWYRYAIDQWVTNQTESGTEAFWKTLTEEYSKLPFLLNDGTSECVILPEGAEILFNETTLWYGHSPIPSPPPQTFWQRLISGSAQYRYREQRLALGSSLQVTGVFLTVSKSDPVIQTDPLLKIHAEHENLTFVNIVCNRDLPNKGSFFISIIQPKQLIRQFRLKAFIFFIAFLFFTSLLISKTTSIVTQSLQNSSFQKNLNTLFQH